MGARMKNFLSIAATVATLGIAAPASAATITNGSFENPGFANGGWQYVGAGSTNIPGWSVFGSGIDLIKTYWKHADGDYSLDLSAGNAGGVSQLVTGLDVGRSYSVLFNMSGNFVGGNAVKQLKASFGSISEVFKFDTTGINQTNMGWQEHSLDFVANDTSGLLSFSSLENNAFGAALDNVRIVANDPQQSRFQARIVAPVPVPAGGLLLLTALGGGLVLRRKRR